MKTVYKYPVQVNRVFAVEMPDDAKVLTVQMQANEPQMWALVDPQSPKRERTFMVLGTGHEVPDLMTQGMSYIGTFQINGGVFVFHLFETQMAIA